MEQAQLFAQMTEAPIDLVSVQNFFDSEGHGAQVFFYGRVRRLNLGREVSGVSYDAHTPLATRTLLEIAREANAQWGPGLQIHILHRTGRVAVGEVSVSIGVSSPHRDEAYQASRYVIEQIKLRPPIWKKEHYLDGDSEWLQGHALCQHAGPSPKS